MVKVSLRSRPELSGAEILTAVFDILNCNFSELIFSSLPIKTFTALFHEPVRMPWITGFA